MEKEPEVQNFKTKSVFSIPGTRPNIQSSQLLISTGIPSVDLLLGGGLPVGSIVLIEEDKSGCYAKILLRYFLAEGVVHKHGIFVASKDDNPNNMTKQLPAVLSSDPEPQEEEKKQEKMMTIAFRYQKLPTAKKPIAHNFGNYYDLTKTMPAENFENVDMTTWPEQKNSDLSNYCYDNLLKSIRDKLENGKYFLESDTKRRSILRLTLQSLGSPMWLGDDISEEKSKKELNKFIYSLRCLLRYSFAVAIVTVPSHLYSETFPSRLYNLCDVAIGLESFAGTPLENNVALSDYQGYFRLKKLAAINTLVSNHPGSVEYVFKLRRKKFMIEMLSLPPDLGEHENDNKNPKMGCSYSGGKGGNLDF